MICSSYSIVDVDFYHLSDEDILINDHDYVTDGPGWYFKMYFNDGSHDVYGPFPTKETARKVAFGVSH